MSARRSLTLAIRDQLKDSTANGGLGLTVQTCEVQFDGRPPPLCGQWFYAVHQNPRTNQLLTGDQSTFGAQVTISARSEQPFDRLGTDQVELVNGLDDRADAVWNAIFAHQWSPQTVTIVITGFDAATTYKVTIGSVTVSVTGNTDTATTASDLQVALAGSVDPGFASVIWTVAGSTITGSAAHRAFTATSSVSGGTGTIGDVTTTLAPGVMNRANGYLTAGTYYWVEALYPTHMGTAEPIRADWYSASENQRFKSGGVYNDKLPFVGLRLVITFQGAVRLQRLGDAGA